MIEIFPLIYVGALGLIIGSFLNVVICRYNTGASLNGRSHCLSCGTRLTWSELVPVLSYVMQGGRCRHCHARFSMRYMFVELVTAILFAGVWIITGTPSAFILPAMLMAILVVITVYDMRHMIIPDRLVILLTAISVGHVAHLFLVGTYDARALSIALLSALGAGAFFASLWAISRGRWIGLGDAKLAVPLALVVSFPGVVSMIILSFWVGAGISVALLLAATLSTRGKHLLRFFSLQLTMKQEIPFAPFLIAGFLLVYFFEANVFQMTDAVLRLVI